MPLFGHVFCITLLAAAGTAAASPDPAELQCGAKFNNTKDVERCLADALAQAEQKLAQAREQLSRSLRQAQPRFQGLQDKTIAAVEEALGKAQNAWNEFKDTQCKYLQDLHGAIGENALEHTACALKMVRERTKDLLDEARFWSEKFPAAESAKPPATP